MIEHKVDPVTQSHRQPLRLTGCTPEPLMSYLKALGVFRLVSEQADPSAQLSWQNGIACLESRLDRDGLTSFLLNEYRPTPILAPWNGGSGFYGGSSAPVEAIAASTSDRLQLYRDTIQRVRGFVPDRKPKDADKQKLLEQSRSRLADEVVTWLDVCFVLGEDNVRFFPLLGTGGNDGRLDFTNNFMQRIAEVIALEADAPPPDGSSGLLQSTLFADALVSLGRTAIGQFNPGGIGGANGTQGRFEAGSMVNPWDFVLMIEGSLLFAGAIARRHGTASSWRGVFPFSVDSVAVGYGSNAATEETSDGSRAELWLPLWEEPAALSEVRHLFSEGRAQIGRRQARHSVEFALAVNLLGVNRGITAFSRYGFLKRNGLAFLAAPLGRVAVTLRPQARLLDDPPLSDWLDHWRRATSDKSRTPLRYQTALRMIDRSMFEFAGRSETVSEQSDRPWLAQVLRALGQAESTLATGITFAREKYIRPLQNLSPDWLRQADDGSAEFRLAAALAGIRGVTDGPGPVRTHLEEVSVRGRRVDWSPGSCSTVWTTAPLADNLAAVFRRRQIEAFQAGSHGPGVPIRSACTAPLEDVLTFLRGDTDDEKLSDLLWALVAIDWDDHARVRAQFAKADSREPTEADSPQGSAPSSEFIPIPFEFGVPRLLVEPLTFRTRNGWWRIGSPGKSGTNTRAALSSPADDATGVTATEESTPDPQVFHTLLSGRHDAVSGCVTRAARRHRSDGRPVVGYRNRLRAGQELTVSSLYPPQRLLAAMLFPLSNRDLSQIANSVLSPPESED